MKLLCVTVDELMRRNPCKKKYPRERVSELFAGRKNLTAADVLDLDIPAVDRLWGVLHPSFVSDEMLHTFACNEAELTLQAERRAGREPDKRSWAAIEAKRAWLRGEITDSERATARAAAKDAAEATAQDARAAWVAAWVAAWAAAGDARNAAWAVAQDAAEAALGAAWVVARATEATAADAADAAEDAVWAAQDAQIVRLRELLGKQKGGTA